MEQNDFSNIGKQIQRAVEDAINTMDFKQLNQTISDTVSDAVDGVRRQVIGSFRPSASTSSDPAKTYRRQTPPDPNTADSAYSHESAVPHRQTAAPKAAVFRAKTSLSDRLHIHPPSRVKGILYTVFGGIGLGLSLAGLLVLLFASLFSPLVWSAAWGLTAFLTAFTAISVIMIGRGGYLRKRLTRLKLYLREANDKTYCSIRALVGQTGKPEKYIIKDLKKMIKDGILPHAHIDEKETYLILDDETYKQYLQSIESMKQRTMEETPEKEGGGAGGHDNRLDQVTAEGKEYLRLLQEANRAIPGEIISSKLDRLESIITKIFQVVERHPEQLDDIERFMEYYLPTTVKLVNAYCDFDNIGISGENISMAKNEVESTLDTINQAFERLLDRLYQDEAFDVTTDASVLQAMLKKDGYADSDFNRREES